MSRFAYKKMMTTVMCVSFGALSPALAFAEDRSASKGGDGPYVKLFGGVNLTDDTSFKGSSRGELPSGSAELDSGVVSGLSLGYQFTESLAAELEYAYRSNDIDSIKSRGTTFANGGDLASVAIMANAMYFMDFERSWRPYIGGGVGFLQEIDSDVSFVDGSKVEDLEDEVFAWQAMLGVEVPLSTEWRMLAEARYLSASSPSLSNSRAQYRVDYDNLGVLVGISYHF